MNFWEFLGFLISIGVSIYLFKQVQDLKKNIKSAKTSMIKAKRKGIEQTSYDDDEQEGLTRLQGFKPGHVQHISVGKKKKVKLITRALKPLIFEVPNFLNDEECKFLIDLAKYQTLKTSEAKGGLAKDDDFQRRNETGKTTGPIGNFSYWDSDQNGAIDMNEAKKAASKFNAFLKLEDGDITKMFEDLNSTAFEDGLITEDEWDDVNTIGIEDQFNYWRLVDPRFRSRFSEQTWLHWQLDQTGTLRKIQNRVVKLTKLPREIVFGGEPMQLAHYNPRGHYHAHFDSETHLRSDTPCCHQQKDCQTDGSGKCKICRYITIMTYLNDVDEGGQTAFVYADNATYPQAENLDALNLSQHCKDANLVISPKKGTAVFWYNHHLDHNSDWLGPLDEYSLHGGCDVIKGEKWISNIWLPASYEKNKETPSVYFNEAHFRKSLKDSE